MERGFDQIVSLRWILEANGETGAEFVERFLAAFGYSFADGESEDTIGDGELAELLFGGG